MWIALCKRGRAESKSRRLNNPHDVLGMRRLICERPEIAGTLGTCKPEISTGPDTLSSSHVNGGAIEKRFDNWNRLIAVWVRSPPERFFMTLRI